MTSEEMAWCALSRTRGIGPRALWSIAEYLSSQQRTAAWLIRHPEEIEAALNMCRARVETTQLTVPEPDSTDGKRTTILHPLHPDFPRRVRLLKDSASLPALLYTRGNTSLLRAPGVAIVGARHGGDRALVAAAELASEIGSQGINVTSGYARGVDTAAHLGSLRDGGTTSIVLSEGINRFRPKRELREFFSSENTLVLSQFDPNARWAARSAMARNRLVCALSHAVVIIVSGPERDSKGRMSGSFDAGTAAIGMGIPAFTISPTFFADEPEGNRQLIARGCRAWVPSDGAGAIVSAIRESAEEESGARTSGSRVNACRQLSLF